MKSNIIKMITMCLCMMVVGFAADGEQTIKTLKHKMSNNIQDKMDVMRYNNDRIAKIQDAAVSRDSRNIQKMKLNQALSNKPNNGLVEPTENPNTNPDLGERDTSVEVYFCTDSYAGESSFNIVGSDGAVWDPSYDASWIGSWACHSEFITLADGDYTLYLQDSWGDGGLCAGVYEPGVGTFVEYQCMDYGYESGYGFTVGAAEGCTDCAGNDCTGYESWATDGYCDDGAWGVDFHCPEWNCDGGGCGTEDLGDGTCGSPSVPECADGEFDCLGDGTECIYGSWECDNWTDCSNGSDEADCAPASCEDQGLWDCGDGQCIPSGYVCDGSVDTCNAGWGPDCANGADESLDTCGEAHDECVADPTCAETDCGYWLSYGYDCDDLAYYSIDCSVCDAEGACPAVEEGCADGQFDCGDGQCIPASYQCDGSSEFCNASWGPDCDNGADEGLEACGYEDECDSGPSEECTDCAYDFTAYGSECCDTAAAEYGLDCASLEGNYGWDCTGCECPLDEAAPECTTYDCAGACADNYASWVGDGWCDDGAYGIDYVSCGDFNCDDGDCGTVLLEDGTCGEIPVDDCGVEYGDNSSCSDCAGVPNGGNIVDCAGACVDGGMAASYLGDGWCDDGAWGVDLTCENCDNGDCNQSDNPDADCYVEPECSFFDCVGTCADGYESWVGDGFCDGSDVAYGFDFSCIDCDGGDCSGECGCEADLPDGACDCDGNATDECGVCGGDNSSCADCAGVPNGDALDDCSEDGDCSTASWLGDGWCDGTDQAYGVDLTCYDCDAGDCMGACGCEDDTSCADCCGVANGDNSSCGGSGDVNGDSSTDVSDIVMIVSHILEVENAELDECGVNEADINSDGTVNVLDVITVVEIILAGSDDGDDGGDDGGSACDEGYVADCADEDCCPTSWIGDGFADCEDQAYGCDLTCYENDGGDCDEATDDGGSDDGGSDDGGSEACSDCEFDFTAYGSECCDTAWDEYGINCATLEANYSWDCTGCACPGDEAGSCGDGTCNPEEDAVSCPDDCSCDAIGALDDCSGDGDCCPASWVGDGFEDCEDQAYGCDLTCYENDGGDCDESSDDGGSDDGGSDDGGSDDGGSDDGGSEGCDEGYVEDCADEDCCPASWIGDGFADCEDQAYGCDLTCYDEDGGDCSASSDDGGSEACTDCEFDFTAYGSECCDTAWDAFGIDCATLEANYSWDCSGCVCPGDVAGDDGGGETDPCDDCMDFCVPYVIENYYYTQEDAVAWCTANYCTAECSDGTTEGCADGEVEDCSGDGDCAPGSWIGDGFCDGVDQAYGYDLTCYSNDGGDCDESADDGGGSADCASTDCGYWINYGYSCDQLSGWDYDCSACDAEGLCAVASCTDDQYDCGADNGGCIPASWECDVYWCDCVDCVDESDCDGRSEAASSALEKGSLDFKMMKSFELNPGMMINAKINSTKIDPISKVVQVVEKDRRLPVYTRSVDTHKATIKNSSRVMVKSIMKDVSKNPNDVIKPEASLNRQSKEFESKLQRANSVKLVKSSTGLSYEADGFVGFEITLSHSSDFRIDLTKSGFIADSRTVGNTTKVVVINNETSELFSSTGNFEVIDVIAGTAGGTAVSVDVISAPKAFGLNDAYPNPFNPTTKVDLNVDVEGFVSVKVFNLTGQVVATLYEGNLVVGSHPFNWDASSVASGVYLLKAQTAGQVDVQKLMLMK